MARPPTPPSSPALVALDPFASEEAVTLLRQAADAAGFERARQERALAAAVEAWIGKERQRAERDGRALVQGWFDLEVDLRRTATLVRLALVDAQAENRRRQAAYEDALAAYRLAAGIPPSG